MEMSLFFSLLLWTAQAATMETEISSRGLLVEDTHNSTGLEDYFEEDEEELEPALAVLFPSFTLTLGVIVFFVLSRFAPRLPYTAVMFLLLSLIHI